MHSHDACVCIVLLRIHKGLLALKSMMNLQRPGHSHLVEGCASLSHLSLQSRESLFRLACRVQSWKYQSIPTKQTLQKARKNRHYVGTAVILSAWGREKG